VIENNNNNKNNNKLVMRNKINTKTTTIANIFFIMLFKGFSYPYAIEDLSNVVVPDRRLVRDKKFEVEFHHHSEQHKVKEKQQVKYLLEFLESTRNYCACFVDMVDSTSISMQMSNEKIAKYYGAFLNIMANIISNHNGNVVKKCRR
jgi:hypothetical protein